MFEPTFSTQLQHMPDSNSLMMTTRTINYQLKLTHTEMVSAAATKRLHNIISVHIQARCVPHSRNILPVPLDLMAAHLCMTRLHICLA